MPPVSKLRKRHDHNMFDAKIYRDRYYVWCYLNFKVNLIPISWDDRKLAKFVLSNCFGKQVFNTLHIIKGSKAIRNKMTFGKNSFYNEELKKMDVVRKYYIPPQWKKDKHSKRHFLLRIYRYKGDDVLNHYYQLVYGSSSYKPK